MDTPFYSFVMKILKHIIVPICAIAISVSLIILIIHTQYQWLQVCGIFLLVMGLFAGLVVINNRYQFIKIEISMPNTKGKDNNCIKDKEGDDVNQKTNDKYVIPSTIVETNDKQREINNPSVTKTSVEEEVSTDSITIILKSITLNDDGCYVELESANKKASIYYQIDNNNFLKYSERIYIQDNCIVKAYAEFGDKKTKPIEIPIDSLKVTNPVVTVAGRKISITSTTPNSQIYYTIDGKKPSTCSSLYKGEFEIRKSCVIKVFATRTNWDDSDIVSEEIKITPTKEERVRVFTNEKSVVGISYRGDSHIKSDVVCQDFHHFSQLNNIWSIAIVSDGAGSAKHSDEGSRAVCGVFKYYAEELVNNNKSLQNGELLDAKSWDIEFRGMLLRFQKELKEQLKQKSVSQEYPFESFAATIILLLFSKSGYMVAHVGDGRAGVKINGNWKSILTPHKGEEANQTIFSTAKYFQERPNLKMSHVYVPETSVEKQQIEAFVLMSDGCENGAWVTYQRKNLPNGDFRVEDVNLPRINCLEDCLAIIAEPKDKRQHLMIQFVSEYSNAFENEPDDKTILIGKTK